MNHRFIRILLIAGALATAPVVAETETASPAANLRSLHGFFFRDIAEAAAQVNPESYGFSATDEVRTFGQLVGHIAQASFGLCSMARDVDPPAESRTIEERAEELGKSGLARELAAAQAYCDETFAGLKNAEVVSKRGTAVLSKVLFDDQPVSTAAVLIFQVSHIADHLGNLVTYLRLLGEVPPSTRRAQAADGG